jgi:heme/copper-type cytochrome/quinol oxidase subunit 2
VQQEMDAMLSYLLRTSQQSRGNANPWSPADWWYTVHQEEIATIISCLFFVLFVPIFITELLIWVTIWWCCNQKFIVILFCFILFDVNYIHHILQQDPLASTYWPQNNKLCPTWTHMSIATSDWLAHISIVTSDCLAHMSIDTSDWLIHLSIVT